MSLYNGFMNSTITCSGHKEVDLDALNLIASGTHTCLCACSYANDKGHHHFIYGTENMTPFVHIRSGLTFEELIGFLSAGTAAVKLTLTGGLVADNFRLSKEYIFLSHEGYKFVYIPIVRKGHLHAKDLLLKLIADIHSKDERICQIAKQIKKAKTDLLAIDEVERFVKSFGVVREGLELSEGETSLLGHGTPDQAFAEAGTSLLNQSAPMQVFAEEGTSILSQPAPVQVFAEEGTSLLSQPEPVQIIDEADILVPSQEVPVQIVDEADILVPNQDAPVPVLEEAAAPAEQPEPAPVYEEASAIPVEQSEPTPVFEEAGTSLLNQPALAPVFEEAGTSLLSQPEPVQIVEESQIPVMEPPVQQDDDESYGSTVYSEITVERPTIFISDDSSEGETTVLSAQPQPAPNVEIPKVTGDYAMHLIRSSTREDICVEVTPFTIGKDRRRVDYAVDNDSVSRSHATILFENGVYCIVDNGSTNGTMVEGVRLQGSEKAELDNGYFISMGNESFQVILERR